MTSTQDEQLRDCPICHSGMKYGKEDKDSPVAPNGYYLYHDYGPIGSEARKCHINIQGHFASKGEMLEFWNSLCWRPGTIRTEDEQLPSVAAAIMAAPTRNATFADFIHDDEALSAAQAAIAAMSSLPAPDTEGEVGEAFLRLCEEIGISATSSAYLEYRSRKQTSPQESATGERDDLRDAREVVAKWRIGYGEAIRAGEAWQEMVEAVRMGIAFARDAEETNK